MNADSSSTKSTLLQHRRLQFLVICTIMGAAILYTSLTSGVFQPLDIKVGSFPGGDFVYKTAKRDYAASGSLERHIAEQVGDGLRHNTVDQVYSIFLDDPRKIADGRRWRFASGYLVNNPKTIYSDGAALQQRLLSCNEKIQRPTKKEVRELPAGSLWKRLLFKQTTLPKVKAGVVNFPFTNGFVSCLIFSMRILPAMRQYAKSQGYFPAVVISTCSEKERMCTHFVPLIDDESMSKTTPYLLGQPHAEEYLASLPPPTPMLSYDDIDQTFGRLSVGRFLGFGKRNPRDEL